MITRIQVAEEARHLIQIIESADGEPLTIRDMVLEGDAIDQIAYILNKPPSSTTWKDIDAILEILKSEGEINLHNELFNIVNGTDSPTMPEGSI